MSKLIAESSHPALDEQRVWDTLCNVPDPELPVISVVDMGIVQHIRVDAARSYIHVDITPTFAGCPAISQIRAEIRNRLLQLASTVEVDVTVQPWTSDLLKEEAREKLRRVGIAPPPRIGRGRAVPMLMNHPLTCPHCGSQQTTLENTFGPTPCRAIAYCAQCHQPFEQFKPL